LRVNGKIINEIEFYVNLDEEENNITIKFNKKLKNCNVMFYGLSNITKINLKNFDTSEVTSMVGMFYNCINLISLDLTDNNKMINMFYDCSNLISLNLSNLNKLSFNTSSVTRMDYMFYNCRNLISLD
jgi:surface protein